MDNSVEVWRRGNKKEIWECFCGFLDLGLDDFMRVQQELLMEQIGLLANCQLGREILGETVPKSVDEFRSRVKLTRYDAYEPYLLAKREDVLPVKPYVWVCTSGASGKTKWVPLGEAGFDSLLKGALAVHILSTSDGRGNFSLAPGDTLLNLLAPPPYSSGVTFEAMDERYKLRLMPPFEDIREIKDMGTRAARVFQLGLRNGIDILPGLPSALVKVGESFKERRKKSIATMLHPKAAYRILRAVWRSKREGRDVLPRDFWDFKAIIVGGVDLVAYRDKIRQYWGADPYETYVNTEFGATVACQTWTRKGLTPMLWHSFLEFIPEEESLRSLVDPAYQPSTVLLNELSVGKRYELAFTNFHGGPFTRYRPGDMLKVTALGDEEAGVRLPQFAVEGRADKLIDLAGFTRLDERTIWQALEAASVRFEGWMARKEIEEGQPVLRLYLAIDDQTVGEGLADRIHEALKRYDSSYEDLEILLKMKPLRLTLLPWGTFEKYDRERIAAGADPGHMKDQHINPPDWALERVKALGGIG